MCVYLCESKLMFLFVCFLINPKAALRCCVEVLKGQTDGQLKNMMLNMGPDVSEKCSYLESYQLTNTAK